MCWKLLLMSSCWFLQKIRTVELDGKVIKLQIVSWQHMSVLSKRISIDVVENEKLDAHPLVSAVGHGWSGALPDNHKQLLPGGARHYRTW